MVSANSSIGAAILVIEDDEHVLDRVTQALRLSGFRTISALGRDAIFAHIAAGECAAIVLDLGLPSDDGISIAKAIRKVSKVPILMLTGRAGIHSRVAGLEAGADDYLVKPFAPEELVARMRAILRRAPKPETPRGTEVAIQLGRARLDLQSGGLESPKGSSKLTSREMILLLALCRSEGILSRDATYREVFQREWDPGDRSLDVHVANLRRKLESVCDEPVVIATVRGEGYELRVPAKILAQLPE